MCCGYPIISQLYLRYEDNPTLLLINDTDFRGNRLWDLKKAGSPKPGLYETEESVFGDAVFTLSSLLGLVL